MIQAFFFDLNRVNGDRGRPDGIEPFASKKVVVLGAGMMGAAIAYVCAKAGIEVVLKDVSQEAADRGKGYSEKLVAKAVERGRQSQEDGDALLAAIRKIAATVAERSPGARVARVLVQPMVFGLGEVLLGYRVDRDVGALIMVAAGGVLTEIARDRSLRLAPIDLATAHEMIAEVRSLIALAGYRGRPAGDLDALAHAMVALSRLADDASIAEAEINPLIVREAGEGVVAVDALVKLARNA